MADSFIGITEPAVPNKKLDSESLTIGLNTVERERVQISGDSPTDIAPVTAADGLLVNLGANNDVSGSVSVSAMPANTLASGTITANGQTVSITVPPGGSSVGLQIAGTWVGQIEFEATVNGTDFISVYASNNSGNSTNATAGNGGFILPGAGFLTVRVRSSAWTSGTANINFNASIGDSGTMITQALPAGSNNIGDVDVVSVPAPLSTTGGGTEAAALRVTLANDSTGLVSVDDNGGSLTVDGTVTANPTKPSTGAFSNVSRNASNVTLLSANASRIGATIYNDSNANLFVKLGATASLTSFTARLTNNTYYEVPFGYTGIIDGIWASAGAGAARMTELT